MEGINYRRERIDILSDDIEIKLKIASEAVANLPIITERDENYGHERFAALLGNVYVNTMNAITIDISAIYEETDAEKADELYGSYREMQDRVDIDLTKLRARIDGIGHKFPEYAHLTVVGDVHTHPSGTTQPSAADLANTIALYESGAIRKSDPFIFGIGARIGSIIKYKFYRISRFDKSRGIYRYKTLLTHTIGAHPL
jgi:hypothetical protein